MTSSRLNVSLHELETSWSIVDVFDAHAVLTAFDIAEARAEEKARAER